MAPHQLLTILRAFGHRHRPNQRQRFCAMAYTDDGGYQVSRDITKPVAGTVQIWLGGIEQAGGWSCDLLTGIVTFTVAPGDGVAIEAACEFDVPARFDTDTMKTGIEAHQVYTWGSVLVIEVKE